MCASRIATRNWGHQNVRGTQNEIKTSRACRPAGYSATQARDHAVAEHMCYWGVPGVPFLTHKPFPKATPSIYPLPKWSDSFRGHRNISYDAWGQEPLQLYSITLHKTFATLKNLLNNCENLTSCWKNNYLHHKRKSVRKFLIQLQAVTCWPAERLSVSQ